MKREPDTCRICRPQKAAIGNLAGGVPKTPYAGTDVRPVGIKRADDVVTGTHVGRVVS